MDALGRPALRYVALGDSYTIGTAVGPAQAWPARLVAAVAGMAGSHASLELVANLAVNGRSSGELTREQLPAVAHWRPGFVSLMVGVNDVVRGIPAKAYAANLESIFDALLGLLPANRILTVSIPDYTLTPRGADYGDPRRQRAEIVAFNAIMASASAARSVRHVDVFDLSGRAAADRSLVADDGLHPSSAQYELWVARIAPVVVGLLA
jgi:lysophospholipase L1-like esterase